MAGRMVEDKVEYWLYPTESGLEGFSVLAKVWNLVEKSVQTYVWHQELFNLKLVEEKDGWCLQGGVVYGDSVEDEWMVVALLKFITSELHEISARVLDSDGEIILIEAADQVPRWAGEPALAEGRVFLYSGEVHLIPVCQTPGDVTPFPHGTPNPFSASRFIATYPHLTRADTSVQKVITSRIGRYPSDWSENEHTTTVLLPGILAALLHTHKQTVSDIVHALKDRDHIDARKTRSMSRIRPENQKQYSLTFPRCLYALLSSIKVKPHRTSGWKIEERSKPEVLGYQLSLGLEILLSRHRRGEEESVGEQSWERFREKLEDVGYFQGEMQGSVKYKHLAEKAQEFMKSSDEGSHHSRADNIVKIVESFENGDLKGPSSGWLRPGGLDGDESWMEVTPESLDRMLAARFGVAHGGEENIPSELNSFLSKISDMAGVGDKDSVDLDPNNLISSMKKLLGEPDDHIFSDEDSDESYDEEDPVIIDYMNRLDAEVSGLKGREDLPDQDKPLEVDTNVLSNLLASYSAELGFSGPASSLFSTLGINPGVKGEKS